MFFQTSQSASAWRAIMTDVSKGHVTELEAPLLDLCLIEEGRGMWIGWNEFDILLGDVRSLKSKRSVVRPIIAEIRKRFQISVAEVDDASLYRRARLGVSMVSGDRSYVEETLQRTEEFVARRPEIELLASKMRLVQSTDF